jgi:hypothetical protein
MYIGVSDVGQMEIHTSESLVPKLCPFDVEVAMAKLERYK